VVILAFTVGGGILSWQWWVEKMYEEVKFQKPKQEATKVEKVLIFLRIFPNGVTDSDLDGIQDIKKRAEEFFSLNGRYVELDRNPNKEIIIIPQFPPKNGTQPRVGPLYIFRRAYRLHYIKYILGFMVFHRCLLMPEGVKFYSVQSLIFEFKAQHSSLTSILNRLLASSPLNHV
jgi:hypothetical protein